MKKNNNYIWLDFIYEGYKWKDLIKIALDEKKSF